MGKKGKRQTDPSREDCESTDSENVDAEVSDQINSCPHVRKAVQLSNLKKSLKSALFKFGQCSTCTKEARTASSNATKLKGGIVKSDGIKLKSGKLTFEDLKKQQLERAKAEQRAAAEKLKRDREEKEVVKNDRNSIDASVSNGSIEPLIHPKDEVETKLEEALENTETITKESDKVVIKLEEVEASGSTSETKIKEASEKTECKPSIWLCLKCGFQGCSAGEKGHSYAHFKQPRSDLHCLVLNVESLDIWCYECQKEIHLDSNKKLYEVVEFVKKTKANPSKLSNNKSKPNFAYNGVELGSTLNKTVGKNEIKNPSTLEGLSKVKGLNNLGNTCFFNSIVQCLSQTHILKDIVEAQVQEDSKFSVACFGCPETSDADSFIDLELKLASAGATLASFASFLKQMHSPGVKSASISPGHLFGQVAKLSPKFRGMQQQDSHEVLRYLMEALRTEEAKRQKTSILKFFGLNEKTDPKTVAKHLKKKLQVYGRSGNHTYFDKIFSGQFVSTIVCEECSHSSQNYEQFLDLSLQVVEDKPCKPSKKSSDPTSDCVDGNVSSVYKGKGKKKKGRSKKSLQNEKKNSYNKSEELKSELQGNEAVVKSTILNEKVYMFLGNKPVIKEGNDNVGWKDDAGEDDGNEEDDEEEENGEDDYPELLVPVVESLGLESRVVLDETSSLNPVEDLDTGTSVNGDVEDNEDNEDNYSNDEWILSKNLLQSIGKLNQIVITDNLDPHMLKLCEKLANLDMNGVSLNGTKPDVLKSIHKRRLQKEWTTRSLSCLSPRYRSSSGECSIYSCLSSFTQSELLTGHNKWACDSCTKLKASGDTKTVYSNASKQLLIFSPPPILTLHLKRFQQTLSGCKKVNKHVSFPLELDLAPFCSSTAKSLPTVSSHQQKILYSLYGVVEHSGSLHGGHYTAFVKVRLKSEIDLKMFSTPLCKPSDIPWLFEEMDKKLVPAVDEASANGESEDPVLAEEANYSFKPPKRWFHASDTSVTEVSEEKVLKAQAYLLFYERIL